MLSTILLLISANDDDAPTTRARELVRGAFDLHVHVDPDVVGRIVDDVTLAEQCREHGLAGFGLKSHYTSTAERARVVNRVVPEVRAIGAITLNAAVGGLNPLAVEIAAREGARIVWLPTVDAVNEASARDREYPPGAHVPMWVAIQQRAARGRHGAAAGPGRRRRRRRRSPRCSPCSRSSPATSSCSPPATSAATRSSPSSTPRSRPASATSSSPTPSSRARTSRSRTRWRWPSAARCSSAASPRRTPASAPGSTSSRAIRATGAGAQPALHRPRPARQPAGARTGSRCSPTACSRAASARRRSGR